MSDPYQRDKSQNQDKNVEMDDGGANNFMGSNRPNQGDQQDFKGNPPQMQDQDMIIRGGPSQHQGQDNQGNYHQR